MNEDQLRHLGTETPLSNHEKVALVILGQKHLEIRTAYDAAIEAEGNGQLADQLSHLGIEACEDKLQDLGMGCCSLALRVCPKKAEYDAKRITLRINYGRSFFVFDDYEEAKLQHELTFDFLKCSHLNKLKSLDGERARLNTYYGSSLRSLGDSESAKRHHEEALALHELPHVKSDQSLDVERVRLYLNYGNVLSVLGDELGARMQYARALRLEKQPHLKNNQKLDGIRFSLFMKFDPEDFNAARLGYKAMLELYNKQHLTNNSKFYVDRANMHFNYACILKEVGDLNEAITQIEAALALHKIPHLEDNPELDIDRVYLHVIYTDILISLGYLNDAKIQVKAALALYHLPHMTDNPILDAKLSYLLIIYVGILKDLGELNEAKTQIKVALALHQTPHLADNPELDSYRAFFHMIYAEISRKLGDLNRAKTQIKIALALHQLPHLADNPKLDIKRASMYCYYSEILVELGDFNNAKAQAEAALALYQLSHLADNHKLDVDRAEMYMNYGIVLDQLSDLNMATSQYENAIALHQLPHLSSNPNLDFFRTTLYTNYAITLEKLGNLNKAKKQLEFALSLSQLPHLVNDPSFNMNNANLIINYAGILGELGDLNEAKVQYEVALVLLQLPHLAENLELDSTRAKLHSNYGIIIHKLDDLDGAKAQYKIALALLQQNHLASNPGLDAFRAILHMSFGKTFHDLGDLNEAKVQYEVALSLYQLPHLSNNPGLDLDLARLNLFYAATLAETRDLIYSWKKINIVAQLLVTTKLRTKSWPYLSRKVIQTIKFFQFEIAWAPLIEPLSREFVDYMNTAPETIARQAQNEFAYFFAIFLSLCLERQRLDLIPQILSSVNGRRLAGLVHTELLKQQSEGEDFDSPLHRNYAETLAELRRLQLKLQSFSGDLHKPSDGNRSTEEPASHTARNQALDEMLEAYDTCHRKWQNLRDELATTDPAFTVMSPDWTPTLETLQNRLHTYEALVILVDFPRENEDNTVTHQPFAFIVRRQHNEVIDLPGVEKLPLKIANYQVSLSRSSRACLRDCQSLNGISDIEAIQNESSLTQGFVLKTLVQKKKENTGVLMDTSNKSSSTKTIDTLIQQLSDQLWSPLKTALDGIQCLHVISHGDLHLLPYEQGMQDVDIYHYPGLISYVLRHHPLQKQPKQEVGQISIIHAYDSANSSEATIPFTAIDQGAMQAIWQPKTDALTAYLEEQPTTSLPLQRVCLSGHGQHDPQDPWKGGIIIGPEQRLNALRILDTSQTSTEVQSWACSTGAVTDSIDGEPIGLVTVWLMKQTKYVIAAVMPISDFYSPILVCLYNQALKAGFACDQALREAKRRLAEGDWYTDTSEILAPLYIQVIKQELNKLRQDNKWLSAPVLKNEFHYLLEWPGVDKPDVKTLVRSLRSEDQITQQAQHIWQSLFDNRQNLGSHPDVQNLLVWVRGFGQPAECL